MTNTLARIGVKDLVTSARVSISWALTSAGFGVPAEFSIATFLIWALTNAVNIVPFVFTWARERLLAFTFAGLDVKNLVIGALSIFAIASAGHGVLGEERILACRNWAHTLASTFVQYKICRAYVRLVAITSTGQGVNNEV